jgi:hypothetical protein
MAIFKAKEEGRGGDNMISSFPDIGTKWDRRMCRSIFLGGPTILFLDTAISSYVRLAQLCKFTLCRWSHHHRKK